ncbi:AraC family transcriptional regulator [Noviherbaspirillum sedimenti]|uniref:AraC family transcriptional regulator n=1 Tax=Noviherbaspirillum sedimenti TaxID=2320865 RepID=A0A3A3FZ39_9BURK|nr:AraC family transcriptional regulator [Noviherbaspirillum sedimenti]RJG00615.1 AraC family transcriptional regulator [Noviherbaspirillum sedimenti]
MASSLSDLLRVVRFDDVDSALVTLRTTGSIHFPHHHRGYFHLVLEGGLKLRTAGSQQVFSAQSGDILFLVQGTQHEISVDFTAAGIEFRYLLEHHRLDAPPALQIGSGTVVAKLLSGVFGLSMGRTSRGILPEVMLMPSRIGHFPERSAPQGACDIELACQGVGASAFVSCYVHTHFVQAVRSYVKDQVQAPSRAGVSTTLDIKALKMPQIHVARRLINGNLGQHWTVASLAQAVGMSRSVFAASFAHAVGESPMHYVTRFRMERATELLRLRTLTVAEIAQNLGYESQSSFARAFRKFHGLSPDNYRTGSDTERPIETFRSIDSL